MKRRLTIIGAGKLAWSLIPALQNAGMEVIQLISRSASSRKKYAQTYQIPQNSDQLAHLDPTANWVWLCLPDQAIAETAQQLQGHLQARQILLHSSGSTDIQSLEEAGGQAAVLYPMQIFTTASQVDFRSVPIFVEGEAAIFPLVERLAQKLSERVYPLDSAGRLRLHLGAVIACNFSNYLYRWAAENLPDIPGLDFRIYEPLVREQVEKVFQFLPQNTQTGPAIRGDIKVLLQHLSLLENEQQRRIYRELSLLINDQLPI